LIEQQRRTNFAVMAVAEAIVAGTFRCLQNTATQVTAWIPNAPFHSARLAAVNALARGEIEDIFDLCNRTKNRRRCCGSEQ
jgi:hypothetical protein